MNKLMLLLSLMILPASLYAGKIKIAVAGLNYTDPASYYCASLCSQILNEEIAVSDNIEAFNTKLALVEMENSNLDAQERLDFVMRSGADIGITGEVERTKGGFVFRLCAVRLSGGRKGEIVASYASRVEPAPSENTAILFVCREHCMRFIELMSEKIAPGMKVQDYYSAKVKSRLAATRGQESAKFIFTSPLLSVLSPFACAYGYLASMDYEGFGLWAVNTSPYYAVSFSALYREIKHYRGDGESSGGAARAFLIYNTLAGGISPFVAFSTRSSYSHIRNYEGTDTFSGNTATSVFLSLVGSGAGHFYKGHQLWGYAYYQADSALMLAAVSCASGERAVSWLPRGKRDRLPLVLSALVALRLVEAFHGIVIPYNILCGDDAKPFPYATIETDKGEFGMMMQF